MEQTEQMERPSLARPGQPVKQEAAAVVALRVVPEQLGAPEPMVRPVRPVQRDQPAQPAQPEQMDQQAQRVQMGHQAQRVRQEMLAVQV
jgi:hypothetical protein